MEFFYDIVTDAIDHDDKEKLAELYAMDEDDVEEWMEEMLDEAGMPDGELRNACLAEWQTEDRIYKLYRHIQNNCYPDEDEEEEVEKAVEEKK